MKLPINIDDLLNARSVEWERLEFKKGWNPEETIHTMCAFANDFHNLSGGYIIIGVGEKNGKADLTSQGLKTNQIDKVQKEIIELGYKIQPHYHPIVVPCIYKKKLIIVLWCFGGQSRPYKAPASLSKTNERFSYYIRKASKTVMAKAQDERELYSLASLIPFDDRINQTASIKDIDLGLIRTYLQNVKSELFDEANTMDFVELCRLMNIVDGPDEWLHPKNVGLLFFNQNPSKFFPQTQIDFVHFPEGAGADSFSEKSFKGPLQLMLLEALVYIGNQVIQKKIIKHPDRAEADSVYNYPFGAIEEVLCNAVYHRSYEIREPIEVRLFPEKIEITSFPGIDSCISGREISKFKFIARRYRNRRIGEFLKELDMTEGRGTGIPKMLREISKNGSPLPIFHTDEERTFLTVEFPVHPLFIKQKKKTILDLIGAQSRAQSRAQSGAQSVQILKLLLSEPLSMVDIYKGLGLKSKTGSLKREIKNLLLNNFIEYTILEKPNSRMQKYKITKKGKIQIGLLK